MYNFNSDPSQTPIPGQSPNSGLIQGTDGFFYGTSCNADKTQGAIYRISPGGAISRLFDFTSNLGLIPVGGVVQGSDGCFYGVTNQGGASGFGTVYKVTPSGVMSVLYSFKGGAADGASPASPLSLASDGNIYGATSSTLFRIRFGPNPVSFGAAPLSYSSATFYGNVNPHGEKTTVSFEYSEDPNLVGASSITASPTLSGTLVVRAAADVKNLHSFSTYYYRVKAVNGSGTQYGVVKSLVTLPFAEPTTAVDINADNTTLKTTINPLGQSVKVYFRYGTDYPLSEDAAPVFAGGTGTGLVSVKSLGKGLNDVIVQKTISGLLPQTTYYFRTETVDSYYGTQVGNVHVFTTKVMGQFNGLVTNASPTGIYSGYLTVTLNSSQSISGSLYYGGVRYKLSGLVAANGSFTQTILRGTQPLLTVTFNTDPANHQLVGTVKEGSIPTPSQIVAGQSLYSSATAPAPQAGKYTVLLPPDPLKTGTTYPQGIGYLTLTVKSDGSVSAAGKLGDGSSVSSGGVLISGSIFPFYAGLYGSKSSDYRGSIYGNLVIDPNATPACSGILSWYQSYPGSSFYPQGFNTTTSAQGSLFTPVGSGTNVLTGSDQPAPALITFAEGNAASFSQSVTLQPDNKCTIDLPNTNSLSLSLNPKSGQLSGSFFDTLTGKKRSFSGYILQTPASGGGYFIGTSQAGYFTLSL